MAKSKWSSTKGHRRFSRRDANHDEIVEAFRSVGWSIVDLSATRMNGVPDLLVGGQIRGGERAGQRVNLFVEIKTESGSTSEVQDEFVDAWRGEPVVVVRTRDEVFQLIGLIGPGGEMNNDARRK